MTYSAYLQQFVGKKIELHGMNFISNNSSNMFTYGAKATPSSNIYTIESVGNDFIILKDKYETEHCIPIIAFFFKVVKR
jgi:hypothetical protein